MESFQANVSTPELVAKAIYEDAIDQAERCDILSEKMQSFWRILWSFYNGLMLL
jgi:hypothetical protein